MSAEPDSEHLRGLNAAQLRAVQHPPDRCLQILAGPGSGKTKTLTSRVAELVLAHGIPPNKIVLVTFTNKAANEMKQRLRRSLGDEIAGKLIMGTFHAVCVRFLRRHGKLIKLREGWSIADHGDNQSLIKRLLRENEEAFAEESCECPKPATLVNIISNAKARDLSPDDYQDEHCDERFHVICGAIYQAYQDALARDNALDFDDLLCQGYKLFREHPRTVNDIRHVFIDEFQDTNTVQYRITQQLAAASQALTIVGDPDQSIYGWRSAEVANLQFMRDDFPGTEQIFLEQNYRSTGAILAASLAVVSQDKERIDKSLFTSHPSGPPVVLRYCNSAYDESAYIATEIKRLIAQTGGQLNLNDFAILLRFNALSRTHESALQKAGLPCRIVGGHRFFERIEIRDMLAYLNLADNPASAAAFTRAVQAPKRGIGDRAIEGIVKAAAMRDISAFEAVRRSLKGSNIANLKPAAKKTLKPFVDLITRLSAMASEGTSVPDLIDHICEAIDYTDHIEKTHGPADREPRMENVKELKTFASQVAEEHPNGLSGYDDVAAISEQDIEARLRSGEQLDQPVDDDEPAEVPAANPTDGMNQEADEEPQTQGSFQPTGSTNQLRTFLEASMLSTDSETEDAKNDKAKPKVTISTCHAAKGLEWPVVFLPACEDGTFPFYRAEGDDAVREERRLLFVAMTRAKVALTLCYTGIRQHNAKTSQKRLSPFIGEVMRENEELLASQADALTKIERGVISSVLGRTAVEEAIVTQQVAAYTASLPREETVTGMGNSYSGFNSRGSSSSQPVNGYRAASSHVNANVWNQKSVSSLPAINGGFSSFGSAKDLLHATTSAGSSNGLMVQSQASAKIAKASAGVPASVLATETRQSKLGVGVVVGDAKPAPPPSLARFQASATDAFAGLKALAAEERASSKREGDAGTSGPARKKSKY